MSYEITEQDRASLLGLSQAMKTAFRWDQTQEVEGTVVLGDDGEGKLFDVEATATLDVSTATVSEGGSFGVTGTGLLVTAAGTVRLTGSAVACVANGGVIRVIGAVRASETQAGVVKLGAGLEIDEDGVVSASVTDADFTAHTTSTSNPHAVTAAQVGAETTAQLNARDTANRNRANHTGTQAQSTVTNLVTDLADKAPLASPALTGTPTAPTATAGTNTTQLATTAFVKTLGDTKVATSSIVNDLTTGGTAVPLSAQQGVALKAYVDGKLPLVTTEYIVYVPSADPIANDATFRVALTAAAALTPNGLALSATNRATVLCAPGTVQLGSDLAPPNFVDIVGLGSPDDFKIPLASYRIYLTETITHVRYSNFSTRIRLYPTVSHSFENCLFEDLELRGADGNSNVENWGTWKRIKGLGSSTNLFVMPGPIYGHFEDCETGGFILSESFGSASFYGTAVRCKGGYASFALYNTCAGTLIDCTGGNGSFGGGGIFSGTATGCTGGDNSFGGAGTFSGAATGCTGGEGCFAGEGGFFEGTPRITNCVAGSSSFGTSAGTPVDFSGATSVLVKDCRLTDDSFTNLDAKYKVRSCINADLSESNYN